MTDSLDKALDEWLESIENATKLTAQDKEEITGAGAQAFSKVLHDETPRSGADYHIGRSAGHANAKHHNSHRKTKHLQDSITYKKGYTADHLHTGDTDVGYEEHYYDFLAKIINNGVHGVPSAKQAANLGFYDRAQKKAKGPILEAMTKKYKEVMNRDSH